MRLFANQVALGLTSKLLAPILEVAFALTNLARAYMLAGDSSELLKPSKVVLALKHPQPWTPQSDDADPHKGPIMKVNLCPR